jgi:outer membrane biosynthesis protein TonB
LALYPAFQPFSGGQSACRTGRVLFVAVIRTKSSLTSNANDIPLWPAAPHTDLGGFGLSMAKLTRLKEISVFAHLAPKIGLAAALGLALMSAVARAQVNIDQGKPAAEIFENDCATCHKTAKGLASGKNSLMLSSFLREHYTASRDQAAALAAYVVGVGGSGPAPAAQKPAQDHAKVEEPKAGEPKTSEPKTAEPKTAEPTSAEPKTAEPKSAYPTRQAAKPETAPSPPAPVLAAPAASQTPSSAESPSQSQGQEGGSTTSAAVPAETQPSDGAPVPRDNIPD